MEKTIFVIINRTDFGDAKEYLGRIGYNTSRLYLNSDNLPFTSISRTDYDCIYLDFDTKYLLCKKFSVAELSFYFKIGYNLVCIPYGKYEDKNMSIRQFFHRE